MYGTIFLRNSSRFSFSSVWKNYRTYLYAKEPLNSMALLIVVQMMKIQIAKQTVLIKKTKC